MNKPLFHVFFWLALANGLSAATATPQTTTVEERLQVLEQQVRTLTGENQSLKEQLGWKDGVIPVLPQPGGHEERLIVGGFLQAQGEFGRASDPRWIGVRDRLYFRRARIYLAGDFANDFDFKAELDLQGNTLGAGAGQLARANEIFINWHRYPYANLRIGQLKPAFGGEALASDTSIFTIERSLSNDRLADGRQLAVSAAGEWLDNKLSYLAVVGNGNGADVSGNDNSKFQKSARLVYTPWASATHRLSLGVDGMWTEDAGVAKSDFGFTGNLFSGQREMSGVDLFWSLGGFNLSGECLRGTFKPGNAVPKAKLDAGGWYVTAAYFVLPARLQAVVRQESFDPDTAVGGNTFRSTTFGLNYYLKGDAVKFMVDYLDGRIPGTSLGGGRVLTRVQVVY